MKRESLISFLLTLNLAAVTACFGLILKCNDSISDQRERLARIETKLETRNVAKHP